MNKFAQHLADEHAKPAASGQPRRSRASRQHPAVPFLEDDEPSRTYVRTD